MRVYLVGGDWELGFDSGVCKCSVDMINHRSPASMYTQRSQSGIYIRYYDDNTLLVWVRTGLGSWEWMTKSWSQVRSLDLRKQKGVSSKTSERSLWWTWSLLRMVARDVDEKSEPRSKTMLVLQPTFIILVEDSSNRFGYSDTHPGAQRSSHPASQVFSPRLCMGRMGCRKEWEEENIPSTSPCRQWKWPRVPRRRDPIRGWLLPPMFRHYLPTFFWCKHFESLSSLLSISKSGVCVCVCVCTCLICICKWSACPVLVVFKICLCWKSFLKGPIHLLE